MRGTCERESQRFSIPTSRDALGSQRARGWLGVTSWGPELWPWEGWAPGGRVSDMHGRLLQAWPQPRLLLESQHSPASWQRGTQLVLVPRLRKSWHIAVFPLLVGASHLEPLRESPRCQPIIALCLWSHSFIHWNSRSASFGPHPHPYRNWQLCCLPGLSGGLAWDPGPLPAT